jgi:hypothetical protein
VWFLDLILLQIESTQLNDEIGTPLENYLANQNQFQKLRPTILDFRNGYFETTLIKYFGDQQAVRNIISDIEKLFIKFDNDDYNILYIVKPLL